MPSYKLTYFELQGGRGESIRLALHCAGIPFTDERLTSEQFGKIKDSCPFGQVPVLTVDDKTAIPQEGAILRYVGRLAGTYSDDREKAVKQDVMLNFGDDIYSIATTFFTQDHAGKEELKKRCVDERIPKILGHLDKYLSNQGTTFSAGNDLSIADFKLYAALMLIKSGMLQGVSPDIVDKYTHVAKLHQAIEKHEKVASWYKSRAQ